LFIHPIAVCKNQTNKLNNPIAVCKNQTNKLNNPIAVCKNQTNKLNNPIAVCKNQTKINIIGYIIFILLLCYYFLYFYL